MAGPTTASLNVDFKELRADFHRMKVGVGNSIANLERSVTASIARVEIAQTKQDALLGVFRAIVLGSLGTAVAGILATAWSAGFTSAKINAIQSQVDRLESNIQSHVGRLENRLERIETSINRLIPPPAPVETRTIGKP